MQSCTHDLSATYEAEPRSVAQARSALAEFAMSAGATNEQIDGVRLAVSEAVTNAVLHAYRGAAGPIHVTAALAGHELWILIADEGAGMQPQADRPGLGLGLGLISQVSDDMAIVPLSDGGTEVRILFKLAGSPERAAPRAEPPGRQPQRPPSRDRPAAAEMVGSAPGLAERAVGVLCPMSAAPLPA